MAMQTDLTHGSVFRQLVKYATPLVMSSLLQAAYGIVDMVVAGRFIGSAGLSGITNANTVITAFTQIIFGLCNGGCVLVGQYFGARDSKNCRSSANTLYSMGLALGVIATLLLAAFSEDILILLKAPALAEGTEYLTICAFGFLFVAGYNATSAALRAVGNSRAPLACILATSVVNIVLDIIFVVPLDMGVLGAALATVISQAMSFFVSLYYIYRSRDVLGIRLLRLRLDGRMLAKELKLGIPIAVQQSMATISWLSVTYLFNTHGIAVSAGSGVSNKIKEFCQLFLAGTSTAAASMIAQNIGAGEYDRARKTMYTAMKITVCIALVSITVVEIFADRLVPIFTDDHETARMAALNLRIEIIGQLFYASFMVYHSLMIGSGMSWYAFFSSFINCILVRVPLAFILNHFFGVTGLFLACMIAPSSSVPFGLWYERSNRWRKTIAKE